MDHDLYRKEMPKLTKKMIKDILYDNMINGIIEQHDFIKIKPGETLKVDLQIWINTTKEGARILNKDIKEKWKKMNTKSNY